MKFEHTHTKRHLVNQIRTHKSIDLVKVHMNTVGRFQLLPLFKDQTSNKWHCSQKLWCAGLRETH